MAEETQQEGLVGGGTNDDPARASNEGNNALLQENFQAFKLEMRQEMTTLLTATLAAHLAKQRGSGPGHNVAQATEPAQPTTGHNTTEVVEPGAQPPVATQSIAIGASALSSGSNVDTAGRSHHSDSLAINVLVMRRMTG